MNTQVLLDILGEIDNLQMFALCKDFENLSLDDLAGGSSTGGSSTEGSSTGGSSTGSSSSQPLYGYRDTILSFMRSWKPTPWCGSFIEKVKAPFIEAPSNLIDEEQFKSHGIRMEIGYRFLPSHIPYMLKDVKLPESLERLSLLFHSLGLVYFTKPLHDNYILEINNHGTGLYSLVHPSNYSKVLVEVLTNSESGWYGRFLVLVSLGIGCTVWYATESRSAPIDMVMRLYSQLDSYYPFFDSQYSDHFFRKASFMEKNDISELVVSAINNEFPFAEIKIPANGPMLKAVGLGVMIAFFCAVGVVPSVKIPSNIDS